MCFSDAAGTEEEEADILNRIILDELFRDLQRVPVRVIMDFKIFKSAIPVPPRDIGLFKQYLTLPLTETPASLGNGAWIRFD